MQLGKTGAENINGNYSKNKTEEGNTLFKRGTTEGLVELSRETQESNDFTLRSPETCTQRSLEEIPPLKCHLPGRPYHRYGHTSTDTALPVPAVPPGRNRWLVACSSSFYHCARSKQREETKHGLG